MTISTSTELAPDVVLTPIQQARLHASMSQIAGLKDQIALLDEAITEEKVKLTALLAEASAEKLTAAGYTVRIVRGVSTSLDKKKLIAQGITVAQIEAATTHRPKKPYLDVRRVGEKASGADDE